jgi:hypothetical protein
VLSLHLKRFACDAGEEEARRVAQHVRVRARVRVRVSVRVRARVSAP